MEKSRYLMMQNGSFKRIGHPPSCISKIKFLTAVALHCSKFCGHRTSCCIAIFRVFLLKCKNSLDDSLNDRT